MKKRLITALVALLMLVCLLCVPSMAEETEAVFMAGYAAVDITPAEDKWATLPLGGYSRSDRYIEGVETLGEGEDQVTSNLAVSCIAITDKQDTTALFITVDSANSNQYWSNEAKTAIVEALAQLETPVEMNEDRIFISATGTLSAPELVYTGKDPATAAAVLEYEQYVIAKTAEAAKLAVDDRCEVQMYHNHMDASEAVAHIAAENSTTVAEHADRLNYSADFNVSKDGSFIGVASGSFGPSNRLNSAGYTVEETFTPDDTMGLLLLDPVDDAKDPIVLANWSAKLNLSNNGFYRYGLDHRNDLSADYVGFFREEMKEKGYRPAFFQATSGNVYAYSLDVSEQDPDVIAQYTYTEDETEKTSTYVSPKLYGEKLALIAQHGVTTTEENALHAADLNAPIINNKFRFATEPDVPTADQVALLNRLRTTTGPSVSTDPSDPEAPVLTYETLYDHAIESSANFLDVKATYAITENGFTAEEIAALAALKDPAQLSGVYTRMQHGVFYSENGDGELVPSRTNFATDAVFCDASLIKLGAMTFVTAPADLYDNYGEDNGTGARTKTWDEVGAHFVFGNTNGASGYLPNTEAFDYNEGSDTYYQGTNITWSTAFPDGAGERLMESYINLEKTMEATVDDPDNQIRVQCECGALETEFDTKVLPGHTHEAKEFRPWYDPDSFPVDGNYYLLTDVTLLGEARTGSGKKCIDLNGHTITRRVLPEVILDTSVSSEDVLADHYYKQTRLFAVESNGRIAITDTVGGGKLLRNIDALNAVSAEEQNKITNYGLLIAVISGNKSDNVIYKAELDVTDQVAGGGACVALMSKDATFTVYDGTLTGGISQNGATVYTNGGKLNLYGGTVTGGKALETAGEQYRGNVYIGTGVKFLLAGNATISGGVDANGNPNNISLAIGAQSLTVDPGYTGTAGITLRTTEDPNGRIVGTKGEVTDAVVEGQLTVENAGYTNYKITTCEVSDSEKFLMAADIREYCICGGQGAGKHACENIRWKPWLATFTARLTASNYGGNYYLLGDITTKNQKNVNAALCLDLNGHNITHLVTPGEKTMEELNDDGNRVFYVGEGGSLSITDSTNTPGTISRDLTNLTDEQKNGITNYGLIVMMNDLTSGDCQLWNGVLDAEGQIAGGGTVANLSGEKSFQMYGGTIKGAISSTAGAIYSAGPVEVYGGTVTGGVATGGGTGGIRITELTNPTRVGSLRIGSDAVITGNVDAKGKPSNIEVKTGVENFTVVGNYTGTAGIVLSEKPYHLMKVATSENADISGADFTGDNYTEGYEFRVVDGYVVTYMDAAYITYEDETPIAYFKELQGAFNAYPGGKATITLQRPVAEDNLSITKTTYLDLKGWDITENTGFTAGEYKLYVFDSETDDYTVENGNGYGIMQGDIAVAALGLPLDSDIVTAVKPTDEYVKIKEDGIGTSFHRLNLRFAGIGFRPDTNEEDNVYWPGMYFKSQFGGDEIIEKHLVTYGVGMSAIAGEEMFTRDKSYTAVDEEVAKDRWQVGADANGNSNNVQNGTLLAGIMKPENISMINRRNGMRKVRGQNYVDLKLEGNTVRFVGPEISYSMKDIFEGNGIVGIDEKWNTWGANTQADILAVYNTYTKNVMEYWDIPNIKAAAAK